MSEVILHVYDVTNSGNEKTNNTIMQINKIFKDGIGLGGIFHSAVQVYEDEEWSFGFCEQGTGVFSCPSTKNPMYTFRESIKLGNTSFSIYKVNQILRELGREWPGHSYDLLSKNCNHFCDEFCERLGVPKLPGNQLGGDVRAITNRMSKRVKEYTYKLQMQGKELDLRTNPFQERENDANSVDYDIQIRRDKSREINDPKCPGLIKIENKISRNFEILKLKIGLECLQKT